MNIYEIATHAGVLFDTKNSAGYAQPFIMIGAPGCAKSSIVEGPFARALAKHTGGPVSVITEIPANREPPDFRGLGIPVRPQDGTPSYIHYPVPDILKRIQDTAKELGPQGTVVLFLDELLQADTSTQKVLADLILNYRLGEYQLPKNVWIVCASNRQADGAGVNRALTILTNRLCRFEVELPVANWSRWARAKNIHPMGVAFVEQFPQRFVGETPPRDGAFCTYRSFTSALNTLSAYNQAHGLDPMTVPANTFLTNVLTGHIGEGAMLEFMAYAKVADQLPSRKDIINNPDTAKVPYDWEIGAQYAAASLATSIAMEEDILNQAPAVQYLLRIPTKELVVRHLWEINRHSGGGLTLNNPAAGRFIADNKALITDAVQA